MGIAHQIIAQPARIWWAMPTLRRFIPIGMPCGWNIGIAAPFYSRINPILPTRVSMEIVGADLSANRNPLPTYRILRIRYARAKRIYWSGKDHRLRVQAPAGPGTTIIRRSSPRERYSKRGDKSDEYPDIIFILDISGGAT